MRSAFSNYCPSVCNRQPKEALIVYSMLSVEECRRIFEKHGEHHSEEEIAQIRRVLYQLARHQINDLENQENEECHTLHKSLHRRTG